MIAVANAKIDGGGGGGGVSKGVGRRGYPSNVTSH